LTFSSFTTKLSAMMLPDWPHLAGSIGAWLSLGLRVAAALGFVATADLVILYAS
jgi:hypothetical protein